MSTPKPYLWTYARNPWDSRPEATTFSVGIYQWIPKASGEGLKKSNTIRVNGYVADAQAVYDKADALCKKLNAEGVRADDPASWMQKQYSVPKPGEVEMPTRPDSLPKNQIQSIRRRTAKQWLLPVGFVQSHASTFVRRVDEVIQLVNFQTARWGGTFTINLGLHYVFTPPLVQMKCVSWKTLDLLDCSLQGRIGFLMPKDLDTWFPFGTDAHALMETYRQCVQTCLRAFDEYNPLLANPEKVRSLPPRAYAPFRVSYPTMFEASVLIRIGQYDDAERLLTAPLKPEHESLRTKYEPLMKLLNQLRAGKAIAAHAEWLAD